MKSHIVVGLLGWALVSGVAQQSPSKHSGKANYRLLSTEGSNAKPPPLGNFGLLSLGMLSVTDTQTNASGTASNSLTISTEPNTSGLDGKLRRKPGIQMEHFLAEVSRSNGFRKVFDLTQPIDSQRLRNQVIPRHRSDRIGRSASGLRFLSIRF